MLRKSGLVAVLLTVSLPAIVRADSMDPALGRLFRTGGSCAPTVEGAVCPDNPAFERLVSELAGALAPTVSTGAAGSGERGFYLGVSTTLTPIGSDQRHWTKGTRGQSLAADSNRDVDSALTWNRIDVRKGLPFGLEVGSSLGYGVDTSLWALSAELRVVLFEGFRSGLGALPDVALRGAMQSLFGSSELSVRTQILDVTLSKPFVIAGSHRLTPLLALQALFVNARSGRVDLTPGTSAWSTCAPSALASNGVEIGCASKAGDVELANNTSFRTVNQTRVRLFLGAEEHYSWLSVAATLGFDLLAPRLQTYVPGDGATHVIRQISFHLACGLRY